MSEKIFNDIQPGDVPLTLEMRIGESARRCLQQMFMANDEAKSRLLSTFEKVLPNIDLEPLVRTEVEKAVTESVQTFFRYGAGRKILDEAVGDSLNALFKGRM